MDARRVFRIGKWGGITAIENYHGNSQEKQFSMDPNELCGRTERGPVTGSQESRSQDTKTL